jgi:hypothetical protein
MSNADRKRLAALLGMLGSDQPGERENAAHLAEQFRRQHGLSWEQMLEPQTVVVEKIVTYPVYRTAVPAEPVVPPVSRAPLRDFLIFCAISWCIGMVFVGISLLHNH